MKHNPKKTLSSKKQSSILQWSNQGKITIKKEEVIDLTLDDVEIVIKDEGEVLFKDEMDAEVENYKLEQIKREEEVIKDEKSTIIEETQDINCPVCAVNITSHNIDLRVKHVEKCLLLLTLKEKRQSTTEIASNKRKKKEDKLPNNNAVYVNKKPKLSSELKTKVIKAPTNITPSKRKNPIPKVKILQFPTNSNETYNIAVDAFCYAPDKSIEQYFLTHFHADHYGGISKKWCYERLNDIPEDINEVNFKKIIYCTKVTSKLLTLRFSVDPRFIAELELEQRYLIKSFIQDIATKTENDAIISNSDNPGLYVTPISANHCPGSAIFLFESISVENKKRTVLHCGDFRVNKDMILHDRLAPFFIGNENSKLLDSVYLDTTYMTPKYNFPKQESVCEEVSKMLYKIINPDLNDSLISYTFGILKQSRITDFIINIKKKKKLLILIGTYLIGKENLAIAISKCLKCPIFVSNINSRGDKSEIIKAFEDSYLDMMMTDNELGDNSECVVHLVPMKIVGTISELSNYFNHNKYHIHFERCVGFRPSGWTFSNPWEADSSYSNLELNFTSNNEVQNDGPLSILHDIMYTKPQYSYLDIIQGGSGSKNSGMDSSLYKLYAVPYSEHSSFRELCFFSIFLNIRNIIPTVNIDNQNSIIKMESIIQTWKCFRDVKLNNNANLNSSTIKKIQNLSINDF